MKTRARRRLIAALQTMTAAGIMIFWALFFTVGLAPDNPPACYFAYEHSFPLPDLVLAGIMLAAGFFLRRDLPRGPSLALGGAGGLIFLGLVDFSFNLQNGVYALSTLDLVLNLFINLWCLALGALTLVFLGPSDRHR
ncbi:MAG: hypothetical protein V1816_08770 [Pseudomonadota bacterium]